METKINVVVVVVVGLVKCCGALSFYIKELKKKLLLLGFSPLFRARPMKILDSSGRDGWVMRRWRGQSPQSRHP